MRLRPYLPLLLMVPAITASAQLSISIGLPHLNIGLNVPVMPELAPVPDSPVYYAPGMDANFFFYDGMYWVYRDDNWYASSWYNGPWAAVHPEAVPDFVLRIPVGFYRHPPAFFAGWDAGAPPRWDQHWGRDWAQRRPGWNQWDHKALPARAQLPAYQRDFHGASYPAVDRQHEIHTDNYKYQPREPVVQNHYATQAEHSRSTPPREEEHKR